jgi:hypothetical protein
MNCRTIMTMMAAAVLASAGTTASLAIAATASAEPIPPVPHGTKCTLEAPKVYRLGPVLKRGFTATITCDGPATVTADVSLIGRKVSDYTPNVFPDGLPGVPAWSHFQRLDAAGTIKVRMPRGPWAAKLAMRLAPFPVSVNLGTQLVDGSYFTPLRNPRAKLLR